ncbi:hypothetical protein QBC42DRAFT_256846 [Cladorrhinum samala]|uniref:AB hydrolase-1 domain-containing protein n=1 Tax=Cladorrhinum samala TaxID=585594 RepID=A0AAV9HAE9_9PEZI|nr:hypothetical protein QBC42DRAFT_256846 [Cladorrhinum samala]
MLTYCYLPSWLLALTATALIAYAESNSPGGSHGHSPSQPRCSSVSFHLSATAQNLVFSPSPDPNNATQVVDFINLITTTTTNVIVGTQPISGTFTLNGIYCAPSSRIKSRNVLQILVHGATNDAASWSGWNKFGALYNYHLAATGEGYHTLAIDRLSHGTNPDKPDPVKVVQASLQIELFRELILAVRTSTSSASNPLGKKFQKIVWVGHSFGSLLGISYARIHGNNSAVSFNALVATGVSSSMNSTATAQAFRVTPARLVDPVRFGSLPAAYITVGTERLREQTLYSGNYDPAIPQYDFAHQDFTTIGELGGISSTLAPVVGWKKPVMVVTGAEDAIFCVHPSIDPKECDKILEKTKTDLFPDLSDSKYEYFAPRKTGHGQGLHYSAPQQVARIHKFLDKYF